MKTTNVVLSAVLTAVLTIPMFGQYGNTSDSSNTGTQNRGSDMSMGKPVYESTVQGTHLKVWVMSMSDHKKWMDSKSMKDSTGMDRLGTDNDRTGTDRMGTDNRTGTDRMGTDNRTGTDNKTGTDRMGTDDNSKSGKHSKYGMKENGTHHVMIEATDGSTNESLSNVTGTIQVTSPTMKSTTVDIEPMSNHYGADVNLNEKGQYQFTLNLTVDGTSKTAQFNYTPGSVKTMSR
ncbi:MAG TPA: hypothetical protein VK470_01110 [Bacteroidota bacterium]|nr:hypothetical protein [Bacteroidota bacterium]